MNRQQLGDEPIDPAYVQMMNQVAQGLNSFFNKDLPPQARETGFVLLVFPFGEREGRCNYISNGADRRDVVKLMREQIKRFEADDPSLRVTAD